MAAGFGLIVLLSSLMVACGDYFGEEMGHYGPQHNCEAELWVNLGQQIAQLKADKLKQSQELASLKQEITQLKAHEYRQGQEMASLKSQLKQQKPINDKDCLMLQAQKNKHIHKQLLAYPKEIRDECDPDSPYLHHLNLPRRSISYKVDKKSVRYDYYGPYDCYGRRRKQTAPQWHGTGRYRFSGPFTRLAVKGEVKGMWRCGAQYPACIEDPKAHDMKVGEMKKGVRVCYYNGPHSCRYVGSITITRCPGYFVYRLKNLSDVGYCGV